jgi:hypothetical protein
MTARLIRAGKRRTSVSHGGKNDIKKKGILKVKGINLEGLA